MIISFKNNYIYIRTRKTGSSTIESILRNNAGPDDLIVRESLETLGPVLKPGVELPEDAGLITHLKASTVRPLIRDEVWDKMFKFTSERHPYEKAVSLARHRLRGKTGDVRVRDNRKQRKAFRKDFDDLLDRVVRGGKYSSWRYYTIDDKLVVDDFIRLETLAADLKRIGEKTGVPMPEELPHKRESSREHDDRPAREILTAEQRDIVYDHCRKEFELFGYER